MSKDPAFLFYPNDYLGGTMGMTFEEKGAYIELLMLQFNRGHMTEHMIGHTVGQLWKNIKDKFIQDPIGLWYNVRLDEEKSKRMAFTQSRRNNIKGVNQHTIGHMTSHMENENVNVNKDKNINIDFDFFWNDYDKKVGDKSRLKSKWNKLSDKERDQIMEYLPLYKEAVPDKQFRKNPETFLNNKSWLDEIVKRTNPDYNKQSYAEREFAKLKSL
ncbi:Protein of unknown function DUF1376 [uncultured Caudovirales phage]|uniref:DUF1376 domain-containing protein n=1 Tax=uncultured Caudovirales phage TaxID=2100421 RepID=A0A6J7WL05_9CAUD|nr:Protein of unknown function DUF1376 [uncultured Caudovirales phage]